MLVTARHLNRHPELLLIFLQENFEDFALSDSKSVYFMTKIGDIKRHFRDL